MFYDNRDGSVSKCSRSWSFHARRSLTIPTPSHLRCRKMKQQKLVTMFVIFDEHLISAVVVKGDEKISVRKKFKNLPEYSSLSILNGTL